MTYLDELFEALEDHELIDELLEEEMEVNPVHSALSESMPRYRYGWPVLTEADIITMRGVQHHQSPFQNYCANLVFRATDQ